MLPPPPLPGTPSHSPKGVWPGDGVGPGLGGGPGDPENRSLPRNASERRDGQLKENVWVQVFFQRDTFSWKSRGACA